MMVKVESCSFNLVLNFGGNEMIKYSFHKFELRQDK